MDKEAKWPVGCGALLGPPPPAPPALRDDWPREHPGASFQGPELEACHLDSDATRELLTSCSFTKSLRTATSQLCARGARGTSL